MEWVSAAKVLHANISCSKKGVRSLESKLAAAVDAKAAEEKRIAKILRRGPDYGPGKAFVTFRTRRIARLLKAKVRESYSPNRIESSGVIPWTD